MEPKLNRQAKDHLFVDMFNRREYCLQMYKALHPEAVDVTVEDISNITISHVIVDKPYNDLGFTVRDRLLVLVEAQSRWTYNILLRLLLYMADTLVGIIRDHEEWDVHGTHRLPVPQPEFYVIYTGDRRDVPERICLSRDFFQSEAVSVELSARVISAESTDDIIGQYIIYAHVYDQQVRLHGYTPLAAQETIRICKDRGALREYLGRHEKEVINGMIMLFEQEEAVRRYGRRMRREGVEEGRVEGQAEGMDLFGRLLSRLIAQGRSDDIQRAASDAAYRKRLFEEFKLTP